MRDEVPESSFRFPVKGYVLAGGKSTRMGSDKAMLRFRGRTLIEIALDTLREVCDEVAISGNREDLAGWAPVVRESRVEAGPAAGIEAALAETQQLWVLMLPVDLPMMSARLLQRWVTEVLGGGERVRASYMVCAGEWHPALCLVHRECLPLFRESLDAGDRKLTGIFKTLGERLKVVDASNLIADAERFFANVNTPADLLLLKEAGQ